MFILFRTITHTLIVISASLAIETSNASEAHMRYASIEGAATTEEHDVRAYQASSLIVAELNGKENIELSDDVPVTFQGKCVGRGAWTGFGDPKGSGSGGYASFAGCGDGEYLVSFACKPASSRVEFNIEGSVAGALDGEPISFTVTVDSESFSLTGVGKYSEYLGGVKPVVEFQRDSDLLNALMVGNRLRFTSDGHSNTVHLKGSKKAIEAMLHGCPIGAANSKEKTKHTENARQPINSISDALSFTGKCVRGQRWTAYATPNRQNGAASNGKVAYGVCEDTSADYLLVCRPGSAKLTFSLEFPFPNLRDNAALTMNVKIGESRFSLEGISVYSDFVGGMQPIFEIERDSPFMQLMSSDQVGTLEINSTTLDFHTHGAKEAIKTMFAGCSTGSTKTKSENKITNVVEQDNQIGSVTKLDDCNELASSPDDFSIDSQTVSYSVLRSHAKEAVEACKESVKRNPGDARALYQLGRSLIAMGEDREAATILMSAADAGYPVAMNAYGVLLNHGRGTVQNNAAAIKYIEAAADQQNVAAMANLGALYNNVTDSGVSGVVDRKTSMEWLNAAANAGDAFAMARLGWNHGMGDGGARPDKKLALQWVERALELDEESAYYVAIAISTSDSSDLKRLERYMRLASTKKNRMALAHIDGFSYSARFVRTLKDIGFRFDRPEEEPTHVREFILDLDEWHAETMDSMLDFLSDADKHAAENYIVEVEQRRKLRERNKIVSAELPVITEQGKVAPHTSCDLLATSPHDNASLPPAVSYAELQENADAAIHACRAAVVEFPDSARAKYQLGRALIASARDEEAANWILLSAEAGYPIAMNAYGVLLDHGRGVDINHSTSFEWLKRAAKTGNAPAATNLATAYFMGLGTQLNAELATEWLKIGASASDPMAMFTLGAGMLQVGLWYRTPNVRKNEEEAIKLLFESHNAGETEATYTLNQMVTHGVFGKLSKLPEIMKLFQPSEFYMTILENRGDRRIVLDKLLKNANSVEDIISVIDKLLKLPHPVDQPDHEPVYVVDAYMDNEYVLGQLMSVVVSDQIGVHEKLTDSYQHLVNSDRSFERFRRQLEKD